MYKITSFDAWGSVDISLVCDDRDDMYTMWELDSGEIELGNIDCKFEKNPSEEEVEQHITQLFKEYVERVMSTYSVEQMTMSVYDGGGGMENEEGLNWEDVLELSWGEITYLSITVKEYEVEEKGGVVNV